MGRYNSSPGLAVFRSASTMIMRGGLELATALSLCSTLAVLRAKEREICLVLWVSSSRGRLIGNGVVWRQPTLDSSTRARGDGANNCECQAGGEISTNTHLDRLVKPTYDSFVRWAIILSHRGNGCESLWQTLENPKK